MKRLMALLLVVVMVISLTACGNNNKPDTNINQGGENTTNSSNENSNSQNTDATIDAVKNAKETDASLFEYEEVDGGVAITKYIGSEKIVVIPNTIEDNFVVQINEAAFANDTEIQGLKLGDSVQFIGKNAFVNCKNLTIVIFSSSVKTVSEYAFSGNSQLKIVELNEGLETLKSGCFGFTAITELTIPDTVTTVDYIFTKEAGIERCVIASVGSAAEAYVNEHGEAGSLIFQAK